MCHLTTIYLVFSCISSEVNANKLTSCQRRVTRSGLQHYSTLPCNLQIHLPHHLSPLASDWSAGATLASDWPRRGCDTRVLSRVYCLCERGSGPRVSFPRRDKRSMRTVLTLRHYSLRHIPVLTLRLSQQTRTPDTNK